MAELPVEAALPQLRAALAEAGKAVLTAPPGSGKTTVVPLALRGEPWLAGRRILMLEPRRLATRRAAGRMADLLREPVGRSVGYAMRFARKASAATRIEVLTEGLFVRRLQVDPGLDGVGLVIFDEAHERSLDGDLGLALSHEIQATLRPDLRLLVMSATIDAAAIASYLGNAPVVTATGRQYPVTVHHRPDSSPAAVVAEVLDQHQGDILVFLPGAPEIERLAASLRESGLGRAGAAHHRPGRGRPEQGGPGPPAVELHVLYGALPEVEQDAALRPCAGRRKVVLATNIAETSLTIEGIEVVIDCGLSRQSRYSARTGMSRLETVRVSRASAEQRAGRAGRLGPGHCYRLWAEAETRGLAPADPPEILAADLAGLVLELALWGRARLPTWPFSPRRPRAGFAPPRSCCAPWVPSTRRGRRPRTAKSSPPCRCTRGSPAWC